MGYGTRALHALNSFYSGEYFNFSEATAPEGEYPDPMAIDRVSVHFLYIVLSMFDRPDWVFTSGGFIECYF